VVHKPGSRLTIRGGPLVILGVPIVTAGELDFANGGALWLGVIRDQRDGHSVLHDVALKITTPLTPAVLPEITPAPIPKFAPGIVTTCHNTIGPELPQGLDLRNIAPFARISTAPYMAFPRLMVDKDDTLGTMTQPEPGTEAAYAGYGFRYNRYAFRYDKPQDIYSIAWSVPSGPWAIAVDTTGAGVYDRLVRADFAGKITNPDGVWVSRAWIHNNFQPPLQHVFGLQIITFGQAYFYEVQILVPKQSVAFTEPELAKGVAELTAGDAVTVPEPSLDRQFLKGLHVEPWAFNFQGWLKLPKEQRPPLTEYKPFVDFVAKAKSYHLNTLNLWPLKTWTGARGKGVYEMDVLWPSKYDKWPSEENYLRIIVDAFHKNGIKLFTMERACYPKTLEEFPKTDTVDKPAPYISRAMREYLKGFVLEQVNSGVDGVGIGYDEQFGGFTSPRGATGITKEAFQQRYHLDPPNSLGEDTEAYRKWLIYGYEEFASYLAEAATAAKKANPKVYTKSPTHLCLGNIWNRRIDVNIAEDIVGHTADIDFFRAYDYVGYENLGHYVTAANTARMVAANRGRKPDILLNCPWAPDPQKYPAYYVQKWMYMPPLALSAIMHGGNLPLFWRWQMHYYGGDDQYIGQVYAVLDTMAAWGATTARVPRNIAVLKSRASEDWWQVRQRYNKDGNLMEQTRGYLVEKWLLEQLLSNGYPFRMYYLDHPEDFAGELARHDVVILPFPYSISREAHQAIVQAASKGTKVLLLDRQGDTDEWGNPYPAPLFAEMVTRGTATRIADDLLVTGHYPEVEEKFRATLDGMLGKRKLFSVNTYGNDVEASILEKNESEKIISLINWTDHPVSMDLGVNGLPAGRYEMLVRDVTAVHRAKIGGKEYFAPADLTKFRISVDPVGTGAMYVLYIHPVGK
ncbi:MAG TPA: hypothetical protein VGM23_16615, partial [Armatimonadota bacterium]